MVQIPRLREWRELQGWTQKDLAQESGLSARSIAGYEAGASARPGTARKLAVALGIDVVDLVEAPGKAKAPPSPQLTLNGALEEERRTLWENAAEDARGFRPSAGVRMESLLSAWRESKEREEDASMRRPYLDEMGELLQQAYDKETALWQTSSRELRMGEFSELQAASRFYGELWGMVEGAGLYIGTRGAQQAESAQQRQPESHTIEERPAA
jgi:transcriptional regulator with XRE-family HTH domain